MIEINPFVINNPIAVIGVNTSRRLDNRAKDVDGIAYEGDMISSKYYIEQQRSTSFYHHPNYKIDETVYGKLKSKGRDILLYILLRIKESTDYIELNPKYIRLATGMSRNSIFSGLKELKEAGIITVKQRGIYWVNPFYIFKGNRVKFYREINEDLIKTVSYITK